jgi:hypothetical protein
MLASQFLKRGSKPRGAGQEPRLDGNHDAAYRFIDAPIEEIPMRGLGQGGETDKPELCSGRGEGGQHEEWGFMSSTWKSGKARGR